MRWIFSTLILLGLWSCNRYEGGIDTPAWIKIDQVSFTTTPTQGSDHHDINTVWVYHGGQLAGVYELPAMVPVLANGNTDITVIAGVTNNGINSTRTKYPFLEHYVTTQDLIPGDTLTLTPSFAYYPSTQIWYEDFEGASISFENDVNSLVTCAATDDPQEVFEGNWSGKVSLDGINNIWSATTTSGVDVNASPVFLELSYRTQNSVLISTVARNMSGGQVTDEWIDPLLFIQPKYEEGWKKLYVNLTENVTFYPGTENNEVAFAAILDSNLTQGNVLLDNIKIVYVD